MSELEEVREDEALKLLEQDDYIPYLLWRRWCPGGFCEVQVWKRWVSAAASSWLKDPWSAFAASGPTSSSSSSGLCEEEAAATSLWMLLLPFLCLSPPPDATTTALMHWMPFANLLLLLPHLVVAFTFLLLLLDHIDWSEDNWVLWWWWWLWWWWLGQTPKQACSINAVLLQQKKKTILFSKTPKPSAGIQLPDKECEWGRERRRRMFTKEMPCWWWWWWTGPSDMCHTFCNSVHQLHLIFGFAASSPQIHDNLK